LDERACNPAATGEHAVEALMAPQRAFAFHLPFVADRQLLASTSPTAGEHFTAVLCSHSCSEPVCVAAFSFVRLEGTLHKTLPRQT